MGLHKSTYSDVELFAVPDIHEQALAQEQRPNKKRSLARERRNRALKAAGSEVKLTNLREVTELADYPLSDPGQVSHAYLVSSLHSPSHTSQNQSPRHSHSPTNAGLTSFHSRSQGQRTGYAESNSEWQNGMSEWELLAMSQSAYEGDIHGEHMAESPKQQQHRPQARERGGHGRHSDSEDKDESPSHRQSRHYNAAQRRRRRHDQEDVVRRGPGARIVEEKDIGPNVDAGDFFEQAMETAALDYARTTKR
jgi:hypothetical protein